MRPRYRLLALVAVVAIPWIGVEVPHLLGGLDYSSMRFISNVYFWALALLAGAAS